MGNPCELCPRMCGADREAGELGYCGTGAVPRVARASLHPFEEPCISGRNGSGTVFFVGCPLGCILCQNRALQCPDVGEPLDTEALAALFLELAARGAHNINLVTATHVSDRVAEALRTVKHMLHIPVVYNCGGYERVESLKRLEGLVDVYLPDFKYISPDLAKSCSSAPDYAEHAASALCEMYRQTGPAVQDAEGMLTRGVLVRHLVLPGSRLDSVAVLERIATLLPTAHILLSLMRQYTPAFAPQDAPSALRRRVTSFEYDTVAQRALELGFTGYFQEKESATADFTPDFEDRGILTEFLHKYRNGVR